MIKMSLKFRVEVKIMFLLAACTAKGIVRKQTKVLSV